MFWSFEHFYFCLCFVFRFLNFEFLTQKQSFGQALIKLARKILFILAALPWNVNIEPKFVSTYF
jgi:hypothetical protein